MHSPPSGIDELLPSWLHIRRAVSTGLEITPSNVARSVGRRSVGRFVGWLAGWFVAWLACRFLWFRARHRHSPSTDPKGTACARHPRHASFPTKIRPLFSTSVDSYADLPGVCVFVCWCVRVCDRRPSAETTTHRLRGSDYFSRLTKCLVLSREISDSTLRAGDEGR